LQLSFQRNSLPKINNNIGNALSQSAKGNSAFKVFFLRRNRVGVENWGRAYEKEPWRIF
jgi:hypothetical protein